MSLPLVFPGVAKVLLSSESIDNFDVSHLAQKPAWGKQCGGAWEGEPGRGTLQSKVSERRAAPMGSWSLIPGRNSRTQIESRPQSYCSEGWSSRVFLMHQIPLILAESSSRGRVALISAGSWPTVWADREASHGFKESSQASVADAGS